MSESWRHVQSSSIHSLLMFIYYIDIYLLFFFLFSGIGFCKGTRACVRFFSPRVKLDAIRKEAELVP